MSIKLKPKHKIIGASLCCFSIDPCWSGIYFLLGKEKKIQNWPAGSEMWSDFGGSSKKGESAEDCAAREFHEESLATVAFFEEEVLPRQSYQIIANQLRKGNYLYKLDIQIDEHTSYIVFVKQIPWSPESTVRFGNLSMALSKLYYKNALAPEAQLLDHPAVTNITRVPTKEQKINVNKDYLEKQYIKYWSIPQIQRGLERRGVMLKKSHRVEQLRHTFIIRIREILKFFELDHARNSNDSFEQKNIFDLSNSKKDSLTAVL